MRKTTSSLALLWLLIYVLPMAIPPLNSPDETRYAEIAREMLVTGDQVVPQLDGVDYLEKPPLIYWTIAGSLALFGQNSLAVRLPSAVAVGLTMLVLGIMVFRLTGRRQESILAAAIYGTSALVFGLGSVAVPDSLLTFFLTLALAAGMCALDEERPHRRLVCLLFIGIGVGLAFLTKGFLALVIPGMVMSAWLVVSPGRRWVLNKAWLPVLATCGVILPWAVLIALRRPGFWADFIWVQHVERFIAPTGAYHHPEPVWFYLPVLAVGSLPWLAVLPAAVVGLRGRLRSEPLIGRALVWLILPVLFFSASSGKLTTYVLPVFPPLAVLLALGLMRVSREGRARSLYRTGVALVGIAALVTVVGVWILLRPLYPPAGWWKWLALMAALLCGAVGSALAYRWALTWRSLRAFALTPLAFLFVCHLLYPATLAARPSLGAFIEQNRDVLPATAQIVADTESVHGVCWYLKRRDVGLFPVAGELEHGMLQGANAVRLMDEQALARRIMDPRRQEDLVVIIREKKFGDRLAAATQDLPVQPAVQRSSLGFLLLGYPGSVGPDEGSPAS